MKILSIIKDERISATSVLVEMSTEKYLNLVSGAEDNLEIQRKVIKGEPLDVLASSSKAVSALAKSSCLAVRPTTCRVVK